MLSKNVFVPFTQTHTYTHTHTHIYIYTYINIYGIHYWRILRSSYIKLAWVGFETTTTELRSDALTDWAIRPWVQLALRANFVELLQFHLFIQCLRFISTIALVSCHIYFKRNLAQVVTWVQRKELNLFYE